MDLLYCNRRDLIARPRGYEGYVAKDGTSRYEGGPTKRWLKVQQRGWTIGNERWTRHISVEAR